MNTSKPRRDFVMSAHVPFKSNCLLLAVTEVISALMHFLFRSDNMRATINLAFAVPLVDRHGPS
jgi:hypothetical protein